MNQSECEAIKCSWHKARENERKQVAIGVGFTSHWLKEWREFFFSGQSQNETMQKQSKRNSALTLH